MSRAVLLRPSCWCVGARGSMICFLLLSSSAGDSSTQTRFEDTAHFMWWLAGKRCVAHVCDVVIVFSGSEDM
eukprot:NODE_10521_length_304_cov_1.453815.p2 GENE.NODE_10521_length_304_cov_1.453815~~NODE_10521_length_304_cov_1.453815.p2  ORF type:complete len:83 (-),score=10.37 NODE_10521_length_304_cov_1.453815:55-270(-)